MLFKLFKKKNKEVHYYEYDYTIYFKDGKTSDCVGYYTSKFDLANNLANFLEYNEYFHVRLQNGGRIVIRSRDVDYIHVHEDNDEE